MKLLAIMYLVNTHHDLEALHLLFIRHANEY